MAAYDQPQKFLWTLRGMNRYPNRDEQRAEPMPKHRRAHRAWIQNALARYERPLVRYAARFTGDLELARDIVQDAFLKLCKEDRAKLDGHLPAWLYTVCRNRALDVMKKEGRMEAVRADQAEALADTAPGPAARAAQLEEHALVLEVLATLPANQQEAFRLKFEHGLSYREISRVMDMPRSSVGYTISQALTAIRTRLRNTLDNSTTNEGAASP